MRVAVSSDDLKNSLAQLEDRNVEGAATEIVDGNGSGLLPVQSVSQGCSGGLIYETKNIEPRDAPGVLRRLSLCIVKVSRNGDNSLLHWSAEVSFSIPPQLS